VQSDPELERLRGSIDNLDSAIICMLAERFKITQRVGVLKKERGLAPADPEREVQQMATAGASRAGEPRSRIRGEVAGVRRC